MKNLNPPTDPGDQPIDDDSALLFPDAAPLTPTAPNLRDARAVWAGVPPGGTRPDGTVLIYLHGNNNYVTIGADGKGRVPDWASDDAARAGASGKLPAPLAYELNRLGEKRTGRSPLVLVPEDATHATGAFWAREPAGQYANPAQLGQLVGECQTRLAKTRRPGNGPAYLAAPIAPPDRLRRVCLSGHSGAGLPMEEAARSTLLLPLRGGAPADLWLLDSTYWSKVDGYVEFCARWNAAGRLKAGDTRGARFVCIYRPKTQTEEVADALRAQIAHLLGVAPESLVQDDAGSEEAVRRQLTLSTGAPAVLFLRTPTPHDSIPTRFLPLLLATTF